MTTNRSGFTLVELVVAMVILTVGLLALLGTSALDTRSIMRERNIDLAAIYAARRLELLHINGCRHPVDSSETLMRGNDTLAVNSWHFVLPATVDTMGIIDGRRISMTSRYFKAPTNVAGSAGGYSAVTRRTDTLETAVACPQ
jgi:prepilin-type N-terminal cleavage/methylation domain-containing protein